jgi:hypothetical protein
MGSIFKPPSPPPLPPVQPAPEPPAAIPEKISDEEKKQIKKDRDAIERKRRGRRSTILTGPLGIQEDQEDATNTLLGKN